MAHTISVEAFEKILNEKPLDADTDYINVCTPIEFIEKRIPNVRNVPLDELKHHLDEFRGKKKIYIHCRSGRRAEEAVKTLEALGIDAELYNVTGGLSAWEGAGLATLSNRVRIPLERQVRLVAGIFVVSGIILAHFVHPYFLTISLFVGCGLIFSGVTGWCGMGLILAKMPWNK